MRKVIILCVFMILAMTSVFAQNWQTDFRKAKELALEGNKPIILVFQGSDWCAPCIKLNRQIWSTDTFKTYAEDHFIMLKADFPRKKSNALSEEQTKSNAYLAETYNKQGFFPFVAVLDADGNLLGESGYKKITPEKYIDELNAFLK